MAIDFSDLGAQPIEEEKKNKFDFSDLGAEPISEPSGSVWANAGSELKDMAQTGMQMAKGFAGTYINPAISGAQFVTGTPLSETPTAGDFRAAKQIPKVAAAIPGAIVDRGKELGVGSLLTGNPGEAGQKYKEAFIRKPIATTLDTVGVVAPLFRAAGGARLARPIGSMMEGASPRVGRFAEDMATRARGVTKRFLKTPEQVAQARADSRVALDQGIIKPLSSAETMLEKTTALEETAGGRIGSFLKGQNEKLDWGTMMDDLDQLKRRFPADPDVINRIDNAKAIIRKTAIRNGGEIPFEAANRIKSYIQSKTPWNADTATADVAKQTAGTVRGSLDYQLENVALNNRNAKGFGQFLQDKKTYGAADRIKERLMNRYSSEQGNNLAGLRETALAAAEMATSGNPAKALTIGGLFKGATRYGSQIAAVSADKVAKMLRANPQALGKYAPALSEAAAKGPAALAIVNDSLLRTDPEYGKVLGRILTIVPRKPKPLFKKAG